MLLLLHEIPGKKWLSRRIKKWPVSSIFEIIFKKCGMQNKPKKKKNPNKTQKRKLFLDEKSWQPIPLILFMFLADYMLYLVLGGQSLRGTFGIVIRVQTMVAPNSYQCNLDLRCNLEGLETDFPQKLSTKRVTNRQTLKEVLFSGFISLFSFLWTVVVWLVSEVLAESTEKFSTGWMYI